MNNIAIITARSGSKRIHRKNIRDFLGRPIISYSIQIALESGLFNEVMVSTDDEEIADISKKYGASVPFYRSAKNSDDFSTTFDVINEVLSKFKEIGIEFDNVCCIYPCAPFVTKELLLDTFNLMVNKKFKSVFPIVPYSTPIQRALAIENSQVISLNPKFQETRSQDLPSSYFDAGQFYWLNIEHLLIQGKIYTDYSGAIVVNELIAHDIDNEVDWQIAELKFKLRQKEENGN
jgi:pseudaminic acid cytidylyltransferase